MQKSEMNISTLRMSDWKLFAKTCLKANVPLMTWGAAGIGKSEGTAQLVQEIGFDSMADIRLSIYDPSDLKGLPVPCFIDGQPSGEQNLDGIPEATPSEKRGFVMWLRDNLLPTNPDAKVLINFDEINSASPIVQGMAYQLVLDRKLGDYELPKGCRIMAAGNRVSDRGVTNTMPAPLRNRFAHVELIVDVEDWTAHAVANDILPELVAFVRFKADQLHDFSPDMTAFPTPRSISMLSNIMKQKPSQAIEHALVEGCCGRGFAIEFTGFLRVFRSLPNVKMIETNPDAVDTPSDPCTLYAMVSTLARMANPTNMDNVIRYARRLGREFQLLLLTDISARDAKLGKNAQFIKLNVELKNIASS